MSVGRTVSILYPPPRLIEGYEIRIAMSVDATVHESQ